MMELLDNFINLKTRENKMTTKALSNKSIEHIIEKLHTAQVDYIRTFLHIHVGICAYIFQLSKDLLPINEMMVDVNTIDQLEKFLDNEDIIDILTGVIQSGELLIRNNSPDIDIVQKELDSMNESDIGNIAEIIEEVKLPMEDVVKKFIECSKNKKNTIDSLIQKEKPIVTQSIEKPIVTQSIENPIIKQPIIKPSNDPYSQQHSKVEVILLDGIEYCSIKTNEFSKVYIKNGKIMYKRPDDQESAQSSNENPKNNITGFRDLHNKNNSVVGSSL